MDVAERLGLWVSAFDAIGLRATHQSITTVRSAAAPGKPRQTPAKTVGDDFVRVRTTLADLIAMDSAALAAADTSYASYHQRHLKLQREMEQMIAPLRDRVRQALGQLSPKLRQLAALDAVLEQVIAPREQMLLPTASRLMSRRFEQLRLAHETEAFVNDWREALLSELDLRLEPVAGLIDALRNESKNQS